MTKTMEMMKATNKLKGFEENSSLLFDYVLTCKELEYGVCNEVHRKYLLDKEVKLRYEILKRMGGNK